MILVLLPDPLIFLHLFWSLFKLHLELILAVCVEFSCMLVCAGLKLAVFVVLTIIIAATLIIYCNVVQVFFKGIFALDGL